MAKPSRGVAHPLAHTPTISPTLALRKLQDLLVQIPDIRSKGRRSAELSTWDGDIRITLAEYFGENSLPFKEFAGIWFTPGVYYDGQPEQEFVLAFQSGLDRAKGFLESRIKDLRGRIEHASPTNVSSPQTPMLTSRKAFVVHGHDHGKKEAVARFLEKLDVDPIILHEQADEGRTIIEKFEDHAVDVHCAVVILTGDDVAAPKPDRSKEELRARQNVIFELGFFVGRLGRKRTFALVEKGVALPSDIRGVIYIELDDGAWRLRLVKELKAAGLDVDANRAF
ncbi:MAG: nucleotide-binding protein [Terracidiphilus sp.]